MSVLSAVGTVAGIAGNLIGGANSSSAASSTQDATNFNTMGDKLALLQGFQNLNNAFTQNLDNSLAALNNGWGTIVGYDNAAQNTLYGLYGKYDNAYNNASNLNTIGVHAYSNAYNNGVDNLKSALSEWDDKYNQIRADEANYMDLGNRGATGYSNLLSNPSSITSDPGYQFGLSQGVNALDRSAASKGLALSGAQQKALDQYGQDYASTKYDEALSRNLSAANLGQTATSQVNNAGLTTAAGKSSIYNNLANLGMTTASGQSSLLNSLANLGMASASGQAAVGQSSANAYLNAANMLSNLSKASASEYDTNSNLLNSLWQYTIGDWISLDKDQNQTTASTNSAAASGQNNALSGAINSVGGGLSNYLSSGSGWGSGSGSLVNNYTFGGGWYGATPW